MTALWRTHGADSHPDAATATVPDNPALIRLIDALSSGLDGRQAYLSRHAGSYT